MAKMGLVYNIDEEHELRANFSVDGALIVQGEPPFENVFSVRKRNTPEGYEKITITMIVDCREDEIDF
ncbi:MAG: hypothetical protein LUG52_10650 [Clostridia bacterium]|nr:hypothetical protein [Clostridia bacterium]